MIPPGIYTARGVTGALGYTSGGKEQVAVELEIVDGDYAGQRITWHGYFSEKTIERTLEALRLLGWEGDELHKLVGIDANLVSIVIDEETYEGRIRTKVRWINAPGGGLALRDAMDEAQATAFSQRMKAQVVAHRQRAGARAPTAGTPTRKPASRAGFRTDAPPPTDDDIPL